MADPDFLDTKQGRRIAHRRSDGDAPCVVFLCGLTSDMEGTKALHLEAWARRRGQAFLRFDYSGHGESSGDFADGAVGDWAEDAEEAVASLAGGPAVLVGSSLGGWISLLLARRRPDLIAGMVTIAAAPDFTEDMMWAGFDEAQRRELEQKGSVTVPSDYEDDYLITRRLIEEGRENLVLRAPLSLPFPVRFLQGTADVDVAPAVAVRLLDHAEGPDMRLCLVKGADHRFSDPDCLALIEASVEEVLGRTSVRTRKP